MGEIQLELTVQTESLPEPGSESLATAFSVSPGGAGALEAATCARFGARTYLVAKLGDGALPMQLLGDLNRSGVDTGGIVIEPGFPWPLRIEIAPASAASAVIATTSSDPWPDFEFVRDEIWERNPEILVLPAHYPFFAEVRALLDPTARCIADATRSAPASLGDLSAADIVIGRTGGPEELEAKAWSHILAKQLLVFRGAEGTTLLNEEGSRQFSTLPYYDPNPRDASPAFIGTVAFFLTAGTTLERATYLANIAAAMTANGEPGLSGLPTLRTLRAQVPELFENDQRSP